LAVYRNPPDEPMPKFAYHLSIASLLILLAACAWQLRSATVRNTAAAGPRLAPQQAMPAQLTPRLYLPLLRRGLWYERSVTFAVIGDYGWCGSGEPDACGPELRVAELVKTWQPEFIITTGDNNYPRGKQDTWAANTEPYRAFIPSRFEPAIGNHDYICSQCPDVAFRALFQRELTRQVAKPTRSNPLLRLFFIDSNAADPSRKSGVSIKAALRSPLADQQAWLADALHEEVACFKLVVMHHAPYSSSEDPGSNEKLQSGAGWTYRQWGADIVLSGHAHSYERITRPGDFAYIVTGSGGAPVEPLPAEGIVGSVTRIGDEYGAIRGQADAKELVLEYFTVDPSSPDAPPRLRDTHRIARDCNAG
jgi:hypothetical protein